MSDVQLRNYLGAEVTVSEDAAAGLLASGGWARVETKQPARRTKRVTETADDKTDEK